MLGLVGVQDLGFCVSSLGCLRMGLQVREPGMQDSLKWVHSEGFCG